MKYSELTVGQWQRMEEARNEEDPIRRLIARVAAFENKTFREVASWPYQDVAAKAESYPVFDERSLMGRPEKELTLGGKKYKVCLEFKEITAGQMMDSVELAKGDNVANLHLRVAILLQDGQPYDGERIMNLSEKVQSEMTIGQAYPIAFFLLSRYRKRLKIIQVYLHWEIRRKLKALKKSGGGLALLREWQRGESPTPKRSIISKLLSFVTGGRIIKNLMRG